MCVCVCVCVVTACVVSAADHLLRGPSSGRTTAVLQRVSTMDPSKAISGLCNQYNVIDSHTVLCAELSSTIRINLMYKVDL